MLSRISPDFFLSRMCRISSRSGFSLVEVLVIITVVAILAGLGIVTMSNIVPHAREETARRNLRYLNAALIAYNNSVREITDTVVPIGAGIADETAVFALLQTRSTDIPGSPFLPSNVLPTSSTATGTYRAFWNGKMFEIISPGAAGTGVNLLNIMGSYRPSNAASGVFV